VTNTIKTSRKATTNQQKGNTIMAPKTALTVADADLIIDRLLARLAGTNGASPSKPAASEQDEDNSTDSYETWTLKALRDELADRGYDKKELAKADKDTLVETLRDSDQDSDGDDEDAEESEEDEDTDTEEEEDEDADEEEESEGYTRDVLEGKNLRELKKIAVEELEYDRASLNGYDQDSLIDLILGEEAEETEDEDDEEEEDSEEESEELDEDALMAMDLSEVKAIAKEYGVKVTRGAKQADIVAAILEAAEEVEED
jgi:hypothetical protein